MARSNLDPMLSLAFAMHAGRGIYAIFIGSGVSRAAGILTGWEIIEDLIRRLAELKKADCEPDPGKWYLDTFGEPPTYSGILSVLLPTRGERQQLLRRYFEPTEEEAVRGLKQPTKAHRAIANLVRSGHVRLIITPNFDRLTESSLKDVGVEPTVISTPDAVDGAMPLVHSPCTLVKVHGDYLDSRIKNIGVELDKYDHRINRFLDRVLDEFGLVVCGWSADWDPALRRAFERCKSRRFTTFWACRGSPSAAAEALISLRRAETISIENADQFFPQLQQDVASLASFDTHHPLSNKIALATMKRLLADPSQSIMLHDFYRSEIERLVAATTIDKMPVGGSAISNESIRHRMGQYEAAVSVLLNITIAGCYWGNIEHSDHWVAAIERLSNREPLIGTHYTVLANLRRYPALLILYAASIATMARSDYRTLGALLCRPRIRQDDRNEVAGPLDNLYPLAIMDHDVAKSALLEQSRTPFSQHLSQILREPLRELLPDDNDYDSTFDRVEYFIALLQTGSAFQKGHEIPWFQPECFIWRHRRVAEVPIAKLIGEEAKARGPAWPPYLAMLFGSESEFEKAHEFVLKTVSKVNWF